MKINKALAGLILLAIALVILVVYVGVNWPKADQKLIDVRRSNYTDKGGMPGYLGEQNKVVSDYVEPIPEGPPVPLEPLPANPCLIDNDNICGREYILHRADEERDGETVSFRRDALTFSVSPSGFKYAKMENMAESDRENQKWIFTDSGNQTLNLTPVANTPNKLVYLSTNLRDYYPPTTTDNEQDDMKVWNNNTKQWDYTPMEYTPAIGYDTLNVSYRGQNQLQKVVKMRWVANPACSVPDQCAEQLWYSAENQIFRDIVYKGSFNSAKVKDWLLVPV
jgi:hypothetical protein